MISTRRGPCNSFRCAPRQRMGQRAGQRTGQPSAATLPRFSRPPCPLQREHRVCIEHRPRMRLSTRAQAVPLGAGKPGPSHGAVQSERYWRRSAVASHAGSSPDPAARSDREQAHVAKKLGERCRRTYLVQRRRQTRHSRVAASVSGDVASLSEGHGSRCPGARGGGCALVP